MTTEFEHQDMKEIFKMDIVYTATTQLKITINLKKSVKTQKHMLIHYISTFTHTYTYIHTQIDVSTHLGHYPLFVQQQ